MRFRAAVVTALSLFVAIACLSSPDHCLNPQPDLPSCGVTDTPAGGKTGAAGASSPSLGGAPGAGGSGSIIDDDSGLPNEAAGSSGESAGAGGDSAVEPGGDASAGAAGDEAAAGAAGALGGLVDGP